MSQRSNAHAWKEPESQCLVVDANSPTLSARRVHKSSGAASLLLRCYCISTVFCLLLIVLVVLHHQSAVNGGLWDEHRTGIYAATYVPTAIVVGCSVLWARLDYRVKVLAPLLAMAQGFAPARKTLMLDYITPSLLTPIPSSLRERHYPVSITAIAVLCLKVLAIFATSLFEAEVVPAGERSTAFTLTDEFSSNNFNEDSSDTRPLDTAFAILSRNLTAPLATNSRYAVQSFTAGKDAPTNAILHATVDAFSVDLSCETGVNVHNTTWGYAPDGAAGYLTLRFKTDSCPAIEVSGDVDFVSDGQLTLALIAAVGCGDDFDPSVQNLAPDPSMLVLATVQISGMIQLDNGDPVSAQIHNASAVFCSPSYQLEEAAVSIFPEAVAGPNSLQVDVKGHNNRSLPGIVPMTPAETLLSLMTPTSYWKSVADNSSNYLDSLVTNLGTQLTSASFAAPEMLSSALTRVYRAFGAQMAKQMLMEKVQTRITGRYDVEESRILLNRVTVWIAEALISVLLLLTLAMIIGPWWRQVGFRVFDNICEAAALFATSADVRTLLRNEANLSDCQFRLTPSSIGRSGAIQLESDKAVIASNPDPDNKKIQQYWLPTSLKLTSAVFTLCLPIALFALLEVLLQFSIKNGHVANTTAYNGVFWWTIIATAILTGVAMVFDSLEFCTNNLETYRHMSQQKDSSKATVLRNFNGTSSVYTLWEGIRYRQVTVVAASALSLLSPFLTIFASGLFSSKITSSSTSISVTQKSWFNNSDTATGFSSGLNQPYSSSTTATLIQYDNLTFPQWTYDELALAKVHITASTGATSLFTRMPAVRASVQCAAYPASSFVNASGPSEYWLPTPLACRSSNTTFNHSDVQHLSGSVFREASYFGDYYYAYGSQDFSASCGTFIFGPLSSANDTSAVTALHCLFGVDSLFVDANFSLPAYNLLSPPTIVPGTEQYFADLTLNPNNILQPVNATQLYGAPEDTDNTPYQGFMTALTHGVDAIPAAKLLSNTTLFVEALTHWYRVSMAQVMSDYYRNDETRTLNEAGGTIITASKLLVQNAVSTRLVQVVLLILWALGACVYWAFKPRDILLAWEDDKVGTLNSLGFMGRLCSGIAVPSQDGRSHRAQTVTTMGRAEIENENEIVALVDLPGLSDIQVHSDKEDQVQRFLDGWKFGLGFYEVTPADVPVKDATATPDNDPAGVNKTFHNNKPLPPLPSGPLDARSLSHGDDVHTHHRQSLDRNGRNREITTTLVVEDVSALLSTASSEVPSIGKRRTRMWKYGIYAVRNRVKREEHLFLD